MLGQTFHYKHGMLNICIEVMLWSVGDITEKLEVPFFEMLNIILENGSL